MAGVLAETRLREVADPAVAIALTLHDMRRLAREGAMWPEIRMWAIQAVSGCEPRSVRCEVVAVLRRLRRELRWTPDPAGVDLVQHPILTLLSRGSDCDCLATFFAAVGLTLGWAVVFLVGGRPGDLPRHVLPAVWVEGDWRPVEVSSRRLELGAMPRSFVPSEWVRV